MLFSHRVRKNTERGSEDSPTPNKEYPMSKAGIALTF